MVSCIGLHWVQTFPLVVGWVGFHFFVIVNLSARFFFGVSFFLMGWVGLDRVTQNGPMDDSVLLRFFDALLL